MARVPGLDPGCRRFKSSLPDQICEVVQSVGLRSVKPKDTGSTPVLTAKILKGRLIGRTLGFDPRNGGSWPSP